MPASIGSGCAFFDFNRDGLLDIYLIQNGGPDSESKNQLFKQESNGTFENVSESSGLDIAGFGMGVAVGDINNDGWPDVLVTEYGKARLFQNTGTDKFLEITQESGLSNPHWGASACFFDYDRDGWLDLVIANYVDYSGTEDCFDNSNDNEFCAPSGFPPSVSKLFRNRGGDHQEIEPLFEDVSLSSGIARVSGPSLGVICADFNGDRWPDILFADDGAPNRLWINQQNGQFKEEGTPRGIAFNAMGQTQANMGIALGDTNRDGMFDIFITHLSTEYHTLWEQGPRGLFADQSSTRFSYEDSWRGTAFGASMVDFDNNGFLDIAIVNGGIKRSKGFDKSTTAHLTPFWQPYAQRDQLFFRLRSGPLYGHLTKKPYF